MTAKEQSALDRWAETVDTRSAIEDFVTWSRGRIGFIPLVALLDEFFDIDREGLYRARRALMEECRRGWEVVTP